MFELPSRRRSGPNEGGRLFDLSALLDGRRADNEAVIRGLCINAYLGEGSTLCRVLGRYKMFVDTADVGHSSHLMLDGYWEMWVTEAMAAAVRPGMVVADVGANLGYFTLLLADLVGPGGRVHAFEPNPAMTARLARSVAVNGFLDRVELHTVALCDQEGAEVDFIIPEGEPKNAHIVPVADEARIGALRLQARRLDTFSALATVDFIKIDADTAELAIWRGAAGIFAAHRPMTVFLEFAPARYADPRSFLNEVVAQGFALNQIHFDGQRSATPETILQGSPTDDRMLALCR